MLSRVSAPAFRQGVNRLNRSFHSGKPNQSSVLDADTSKSLNKIYHTSGIVLAGLTPLAFILSPSMLNMPVDIALGVLFPLHAHVGMNYVISDYVPKASRSLARAGLLGVTIITAAGLLKLNLTGAGVTETFKSLWRKEEKKKKQTSNH
jgi:succinate dehydrogenase (ubiquinone) membrane anchor subunit